jgi:hypothetical protein
MFVVMYCTLLFKHKYNIVLPNYSHCTTFKFNLNITILKLRIYFAQSGSDYVFENSCVQFEVNPHQFYYPNH